MLVVLLEGDVLTEKARLLPGATLQKAWHFCHSWGRALTFPPQTLSPHVEEFIPENNPGVFSDRVLPRWLDGPTVKKGPETAWKMLVAFTGLSNISTKHLTCWKHSSKAPER